jgi:hypothetical protein
VCVIECDFEVQHRVSALTMNKKKGARIKK